MGLGQIVQRMIDLYKVQTGDLVKKALELRDSFPAALEERKTLKNSVRVVSFAETRQTESLMSKLVDTDAATIPGHGSVLPISNNHQTIGTFEDDDEREYKDVMRELEDLATISKQENESNGGPTFNDSVGNYAGGGVTGGQHSYNDGQLNYGTIGTQNIHGLADKDAGKKGFRNGRD
ncbi:hypothetical protein F5X98DRAFT_378750 [Xylaria grammica]|nr:hypothetical protein F5X98DRAFT_378750 [Xylaria grammica]